MVEQSNQGQTFTTTTLVSEFEEDQWTGAPSIYELGGSRIGVLCPDVRNQKDYSFLTVFEWQGAKLQKIAGILLRKENIHE